MAGSLITLIAVKRRVDAIDQILEILILAAQLQISAELVKVIVILTWSDLRRRQLLAELWLGPSLP